MIGITQKDIDTAASRQADFTNGSRCLLAIAGKRRFGPSFYASDVSCSFLVEEGDSKVRKTFYFSDADADRIWYAMRELKSERIEAKDRVFAQSWQIRLSDNAHARNSRTRPAVAAKRQSLLGDSEEPSLREQSGEAIQNGR